MSGDTAKELKPLKISCTSSKCDENLHCFLKSKKMADVDRGKCRSCGIDLIDWERVHKRELADANFTFEALKYELIRHHNWHKPIDELALNHARRKGRVGLRESARKRITKSVGPASPAFDGRQTPESKNIIFYAQHALACCCRKCIEYWHGIPKGIDLTSEQIDYFVELTMMFVNDRLPSLTEVGERVPAIRGRSLRQAYGQEIH